MKWRVLSCLIRLLILYVVLMVSIGLVALFLYLVSHT
jgi:hypothetical protein